MTRRRFRIHPMSLAALCRSLCLACLIAAAAGSAHADVFGRLRFSVKNAADEKPLAGAKIVLSDSARVRPDVTLTTDAQGVVVSPALEARVWQAVADVDLYQTDRRDVTVAADTTTEVEVLLEPLQEKVIKITGARERVQRGETGSVTRRDQSFLNRFPTTGGNPQSLSKALRANPGFVEDSVNQNHPRGEHSQTAIFINGFLLPGALQGRAGQFLVPETIQSLDVLTGGFAPEYGGETAAVLNLSLRSGTITPFQDLRLSGGGFGTFDGLLTVGGQGGAKRFGYLVNLSTRRTDNALEAPQPDRQTAHNFGTSSAFFGNFDFTASSRDQLTLTLNTAPARTQIANRTGLRYKGIDSGFGYAGEQPAGSTTTRADGTEVPLLSQEAAGQDIYQKDSNSFGVLLWRRTFSNELTGLLSFGATKSKLEIRNNNPSVDLSNLPADNSIEFNPTIVRDNDQKQVQGSLTLSRTNHTYKFGFLYTDQRGDDSYQLIPASVAALNALRDVDPRLAPGVGDTTAPVLRVKSDGYYAAAYVQDTWRADRRLSLNYGLRLDAYKQSRNLGDPSVRKTELSPRVNAAYEILPRTIARASYNRLFSQPPLAQGAILGSAIRPQMADMLEGSVERQIGANQTVKAAYYRKDFRNQLDTGILIEGTQIGAYTTVNLEKATVKGFEFSYDLSPRGGIGLGGYLGYANVTAKPRGVNNLGEAIEDAYNDHDQLNTLTGGLSYTLASGASAGLNVYYGSGVASSILEEGGKRQDRAEVNLRLSSGPRLFGGSGGLELNVENLFDSRKVINYQSPFSGTRFQQGRRILLSANGRF